MNEHDPNDLNADDEGEFVDLTPDGGDLSFDFSEMEAADPNEMNLGDADEASDVGDASGEESPELAAARGELTELRAKHEEAESKLLRTAADFQNFVRRSAINIDEAKQEAYMKVAKSLVGVLDNFDRAMENFDPETASAADVLAGVDSTRTSLLQALGNFGMAKIEVAPGDVFDPNLHEALMQQPSEEFDSGCVSQQFLPGYTLNDLPVRAAQVGVAQ